MIPTRFWRPYGKPMPLDREGYLHSRENWQWLSASLFTLADLSAEPCVLLLGEPGMGKTTALMAHVEALRQQVNEGESVSFLLPQEAPYLATALHEILRVHEQAGPEGVLHLFIDSLDEYLWHDPRAAASLGSLLGNLTVSCRGRLRLRIACRTQQLPKLLLDSLSRLWADKVTYYELAPLSQGDVQHEAEEQLQEKASQAFLKEIARKRLGGLASRPITLNLLLLLAKQDGGLPTNRTQIYVAGCRKLCEEPDETRLHITRRSAAQDPDRRLALAEGAAAVLSIGQKQSIWMARKELAPGPEHVTVRELAQAMNQLSEPTLGVTEPELRSLIEDAALFRAPERNRSGFSHQTYQEFLTAQWLANQKLHDSVRLSLLSSEEYPDQVAPPFYEVAAWLGALREGVMEKLARKEPKLLLRSDLSAANPEWRREVCKHLLAQYAEQKLHLFDWAVATYEVLAHPGLAAQLEPFITSAQHNRTVRRVAIHIAHGCKERALAPALLLLALDASETAELRETAVYALMDLGEPSLLACMRPLIALPFDQDPKDELKGMVLSTLWRNRDIGPSEVLSLLLPPRQPQLHGHYQRFAEDLAADWPEAAMPEALSWVSAQPARESMTFSFCRLLDGFLNRGLQRITTPEVRAALVRAVMVRLEHYEDPLTDQDGAALMEPKPFQDEHRRELIAALVETPAVPAPIIHRIGLGTRGASWLRQGDLDWLLERLERCTAEQRSRWARLLGDLTYHNDVMDDRVYEASLRYPEVLEALPGNFKPVIIGSEHARLMKEGYLHTLELVRKRQERDAELSAEGPLPPLLECIASAFSYSAEQGESPWPQLEYVLRFNQKGRQEHSLDLAGIVAAEGWTTSDEVTRQRIVEAASCYLKTAGPPSEPYQYHHNSTTISGEAMCGFRALQLLLDAAPERFRMLDAEIFARWMEVLINYTLADGWGPLPRLLGFAYRQAPDFFLKALIARMVREESAIGTGLRVGHFKECWDERMARCMVDWLGTTSTRSGFLQDFLVALLAAQGKIFLPLVRSLVPTSVLAPGPERERATAAGRALLHSGLPEAWEILAPALEVDPQYGLDVLRNEDWHREEALVKAVPDEALATLYILLRRTYPDLPDDGVPEKPSLDPEHHPYRMHRVRPEQSMVRLRDNLLSALRQRPRRSALAALDRAIAAFPNSGKLARSRELLAEAHRTVSLSAEAKQHPLDRLNARISKLRLALREEITQTLRTDADLESFCLDRFPSVQMRFTGGMDREQKLLILLQEVDPEELRRSLASLPRSGQN